MEFPGVSQESPIPTLPPTSASLTWMSLLFPLGETQGCGSCSFNLVIMTVSYIQGRFSKIIVLEVQNQRHGNFSYFSK